MSCVDTCTMDESIDMSAWVICSHTLNPKPEIVVFLGEIKKLPSRSKWFQKNMLCVCSCLMYILCYINLTVRNYGSRALIFFTKVHY